MKKELVLANCVDAVRSGRSSVEECLRQYPALRDELKPLLETALQIKTDAGTLSGEARSRMRAGLVAAMLSSSRPRHEIHVRPSPRPFFTFRLAAALGAVLLAVAIAGGGTAYAAQRSLPGDALYPVKMGSENVQLALTFDREGKANLLLKLAGRRAEEIASIASQANRSHEPQTLGADRVARQLDRALQVFSGSEEKETRDFMHRISETSLREQLTLDTVAASSNPADRPSLQDVIDVLRRGKLIADVSYGNPSFLDSHPSVNDRDLEDGQFTIDGTLTSTDGGVWKIDGLTLGDVSYTGTLPPANSRVRTEGLTRNGKVYVTKVEEDGDTTAEVMIQGKFKGSTDGGAVWNVAGIAVAAPEGASVPSQGDQLQLLRPSGSDKAGFSQVEAKQPDEKRVDFAGRLTAVDTDARTITVVQAGTQIRVNATGAILRTENKRPVTWVQLQARVGRDISVKGLHRKGNVLYASELVLPENDR